MGEPDATLICGLVTFAFGLLLVAGSTIGLWTIKAED